MQDARSKKGTLVGIVGICWNLILAVIKLIIGVISGSISIQSDAINNFGDVISSFATTISFMVSSKSKDKEHPFGHGRIDYLIGLGIAVMITVVGVEFCISSIKKIISPTVITFNWLFFVIITISIVAKVGLGIFYHINNKKLKSATLKVARLDSYQDAIMTFVTLVAFLLSGVTTLPVDGVAGLAISILIIISGIKTVKSTLDPIIGGRFNSQIASEIMAIVMQGEEILGAHDLLLHDYGNNNYLASIHAEISDKLAITEAHKIIDRIERTVKKRMGVELVIHIDPIDIMDKDTKILKAQVRKLLEQLDPHIMTHDYDYDKIARTLKCDIVLPYKSKITDTQLQRLLVDIENTAKEAVEILFTIDYN